MFWIIFGTLIFVVGLITSKIAANFNEFDRVENGKIILKPINPKYPKSYEECCDILRIETNRIIEHDDCLGYRDITQYDINLLTQLKCFRRLRICRDAYWKIAGMEMGLDKPWEPDFIDTKEMYYIFYKGYIEKGNQRHPNNHILIFPTPEMRDAFYENFKKEIEECKKLL